MSQQPDGNPGAGNEFIANGIAGRQGDTPKQVAGRLASKIAPAAAVTSQNFRPGDTENAIKTGHAFPAAQLSNPNAVNAGARMSGSSAPVDISPRDVYKQQQQMPINALPPQVKQQHQQLPQQRSSQPQQQQQQPQQQQQYQQQQQPQQSGNQSPPHPSGAAPPPPPAQSQSTVKAQAQAAIGQTQAPQGQSQSPNEQTQVPAQDPDTIKPPPPKPKPITEDVCIF